MPQKNTYKNFKERWNKLSDEEKLYVFRNIASLGDEEKANILRTAIASPDEIDRVKYYAITGKNVKVEPGKLEIPAEYRLAAKNLARDPSDAAKWYTKQLPQYEFVNYLGDVVGRVKGTTGPFKRIDPGLLEMPGAPVTARITEGVQDVGDVVLPFAKGAIETAAAGLAGTAAGTAAGLAGPAAAGAAAMTAGSIAGAETAAGLEKLTNKLAQEIGFDQKDLTPQDLADIKKFSMLSTVFLGTGAGKNMAKKGAEKLTKTSLGKKLAERAGLSTEDLADRVLRAQSGIPMKTVRNTRDILFGPLAGNSREEMRLLGKHMPDILRMEKEDLPFAFLFSKMRYNFDKQLQTVKKKTAEQIRKVVPDNAEVSLDKVYDAWLAEKRRLKNSIKNEYDQQAVDQLDSLFKKFMSKKVKVKIRRRGKLNKRTRYVRDFIPGTIPAKDALDLVMKLRDLDKSLQQFYRTRNVSHVASSVGEDQISNSLSRISRNAVKSIDEQIESIVPGKYKQAKENYRNLRLLEDMMRRDGTQSDRKFYAIAQKLGASPANKFRSTLVALDKEFGTNLVPEAQKLALYVKFGRNAAKEAEQMGISANKEGLHYSNFKRTPAAIFGGMAAGAGASYLPENLRYTVGMPLILAGAYGAQKAVSSPVARSIYGIPHMPGVKQALEAGAMASPILQTMSRAGLPSAYNYLPLETRKYTKQIPGLETEPNMDILQNNLMQGMDQTDGQGFFPLYRREDYLRYKGLGGQ